MRRLNVRKLNLGQKVAQLLMPRIDFNDPNSLTSARKLVKEYGVGGFIIFGGNISSVKKATEELQSISQIPLLFACDAERGVGQIVCESQPEAGTRMTLFPFTMSLGAIGDERLVYKQAWHIAQDMKSIGLNLLFAPVVDINTNPDNPIINIRSYGDDAGLVSRLSLAFIKGCQANGVAACAKHFPGHGGTDVDSHEDLPTLGRTLDELEQCDLIPFRNAIEVGVASIMTAHLALPTIGSGKIPATVSKKIVSETLRKRMRFQGLIITDSLRMAGINKIGDETDISRLAIEAGCDVVLDPVLPFKLIERLVKLVETGGLGESLVNKVVKRIILHKNEWLSNNSMESSRERDGQKLIAEIARRSVCTLRGGEISSKEVRIYVFDVTQSGEDRHVRFAERLTDCGVSCETVSVTPVADVPSILDNSYHGKALICLVYTSVGAWKKQWFLPEFFRNTLTRLGELPTETALISFGSPYVVRGLHSFDTVICAFDSIDECQHEVVNVLLGNARAQGVLPVRL